MKPYYPQPKRGSTFQKEERKASLLAIPAVIHIIVLIIISFLLLSLFFRILPFLIIIWIIIAFLSLIVGLFVALVYLTRPAPPPGYGDFSLSMVRDPSKQEEENDPPSPPQ